LFWNKKGDDWEVALPPSPRRAHRVQPSEEEPVFFQIGEESYRVDDLSAGGASFQAPAGLKAGEMVVVRFRLPYPPAEVQAKVRIVSVGQGQARGSFEEISPAARELVHLYVLEYQKRQAKSRSVFRPPRPG
jgi:c-di-GMP-binding flagellar brake protein YcgR